MTSMLVDVTSVSTLSSASGNFTAGAVAAAPTGSRNVAFGSFVGLRQNAKHGGVCGQRRQVETPSITAARPFTGRAALQFNSSDADRPSFQKFDGLLGEGSLKSVHSLSSVSTKVPAFVVQASSSAVADDPTAAVTEDPPAAAAAPSKQKIRIKLRSYWVHLIQQACQQILDAAKNTNAQTMGPVPLPTKRRVYCVLRSPHVDKDSREHFEIRTHHRLIDLANPNAQTIDALMQLDLPAGVDVEVKLS